MEAGEAVRSALREMGFEEGVVALAAEGCAGEEDAVRRALALTGQSLEQPAPPPVGEMKMVFVVREELGLPAARVAEGVAHAGELTSR